MIILDTNVVSEMMKDPQAQAVPVYEWLRKIPRRDTFTTAVTIGEILSGVEGLPRGRRRKELEVATERMVSAVFAGRVLGFDLEAARGYAAAVAARRRVGKRTDPLDLEIAGIAIAHRMTIATRNIRDFEDTGVDLVDPWAA